MPRCAQICPSSIPKGEESTVVCNSRQLIGFSTHPAVSSAPRCWDNKRHHVPCYFCPFLRIAWHPASLSPRAVPIPISQIRRGKAGFSLETLRDVLGGSSPNPRLRHRGAASWRPDARSRAGTLRIAETRLHSFVNW